MTPSAFVEVAAATWLDRLRHVCDRIQHCHVRIEQPHRRRRGLPFRVTLTVTIPGSDSVVVHGERTDVYLAIADAFLAARRQLQDLAQIRRGDVKQHAA
jgi:ribosome-associated translation inhibitor RaiA